MARSNPGNGISLNVHLPVPASVGIQDGSHTPNTPEILNSIVNMQCGPFADYDQTQSNAIAPASVMQPTSFLASTPPSESPMSDYPNAAGACVSVQQYTSQFIKDGLRLKLAKQLGRVENQPQAFNVDLLAQPQQPRQQQPPPPPLLLSPMEASSPGSCYSLSDIKSEELTEEDLLRRQRRRERNKVAATKCRNKKKLKTQILVKENESLISQNQNLKSEIRKLEREKKRLIDVLSVHETSCPKRRKTTTTLHESSNNVDGYDDIIAEFSQQKSEPSAFQENLDFGSLPSIKVEDVSSPMDEDIFLRPPEPPGFYTDGFQSQTRLYNNHHHVPGSHHFLGVMTLGHHHYLDLDNRCIAL